MVFHSGFFHDQAADSDVQKTNDRLLKAEIARLQSQQNLSNEDHNYLKAFQHIDSFYRPLFSSSMSDRDLLIIYFLRPNTTLYTKLYDMPFGPLRQATSKEIQDYIKERTYFDDNDISLSLCLFSLIFSTIFVIVAASAAFSYAPISVFLLFSSMALYLWIFPFLRYYWQTRDTSDYLEDLQPYALACTSELLTPCLAEAQTVMSTETDAPGLFDAVPTLFASPLHSQSLSVAVEATVVDENNHRRSLYYARAHGGYGYGTSLRWYPAFE